MRLLPWDYGIRNLARSPSRLALTVAGAMLVVLLVLVAGGFVHGLAGSLRAAGEAGNVMLLGAGSEESVERSEIQPAVATIVLGSVAGIRHTLDVPHVSPEIHVQLGVERSLGAGALPASFRGFTPTAMLVHPRVHLVQGSPPRAGHNEAMVGVLAAARMGLAADELTVGQTFYLDGRDCRVTGIFEAAGTVMESEIWMPLNDLLVLARRDTISTVIVTLDSATFDDLDLLAKQRLDLELVAMREQDYYAGLSSFYRPIQAVAVITAGLIALCGLCGGLNALYAAFVTRVRELASLRTLGFSRRAIVLSLIQESALATCAGGLLACMAGAWLLDGLAVRFSLGAFGLKIDSTILALGLLSGLLLGVVGALPPAWRCLRTPIATALKTS